MVDAVVGWRERLGTMRSLWTTQNDLESQGKVCEACSSFGIYYHNCTTTLGVRSEFRYQYRTRTRYR